MSTEEKRIRMYDIDTGKSKEREYNMKELIRNLKNSGTNNLRGNKEKLQELSVA